MGGCNKTLGSGEDYVTMQFLVCALHKILLRWVNLEDQDGQGESQNGGM